MSTYAVGDIQGCYRELMNLLDQVSFNPSSDQLWVVGDIVNRGPNSKAALEFLYENRKAVKCVLGNHDLHLLAIYHTDRQPRHDDTFEHILASKHCADWMEWLRQLPLCHYDKSLDYCMAHAGIAPQWSLKQALAYSAEVQAALKSDGLIDFLNAMYGNEPALWNDHLEGINRLRCITNYFTRMRIVDQRGGLEFKFKGQTDTLPGGYMPWFSYPQRKMQSQRIIFGHWAALQGKVEKHLFGLDTGCVWGQHLTMMDLETQDFYIAQAEHY